MNVFIYLRLRYIDKVVVQFQLFEKHVSKPGVIVPHLPPL